MPFSRTFSSDRLWAITTFFNPGQYERRRLNFRLFRRHLQVPLLAIELAYGDTFELTSDDAEIVVQISGADVLWQKERLLNVAIPSLPAACDSVVWIDSDVLIPNDGWPGQVLEGLERFALVRPFAAIQSVGREHVTASDACELGWADASRLPLRLFPDRDMFPSCRGVRLPARPWGKAWAARRALLASRGLYDACVVGGGDVAIVFAACGRMAQAADLLRLDGARRDHYLAWAAAFHGDVLGRVGHLGGTAYHLWHGDLANRRYRERHVAFAHHAFDPVNDVRIAQSGAWRWSSPKPAMHAYVRAYFDARREDG